MIDDTSRISDKPLGSIEDIECPLLSGSNITYKWYKNGVHVSDSITLSLTEEFVGIYQCFVENSVGCDYAIIRILDAGTYYVSTHTCTISCVKVKLCT